MIHKLHAIAILCCAALCTGRVEAQAPRPNIVVFIVDDLGWQDLSVPLWDRRTPLNDRYKTPNVERLAAQGVTFTNAYSCAVCSPTRTSLMNGQNAARHSVTQWTLHAGKDQSGKTDRLSSPRDWAVDGLQPGAPLLPELLRGVGYRTIHVGKAHWGANGTAGSDPRALGFDVNIGGHAAGAPGSYHADNGFGEAKRDWAVPGLDQYHGLPIHLTDALTAEANRAVAAAIDDEQPFYLYFAHYAVHTPIQPHEPYAQRYRDAGLDEKEARYASMIEGFDRSLGVLLALLERRGVAESTIILFGSDNGGLSVHARGAVPDGVPEGRHNWPLRAGKGSAYEGGTRVPQIVAWAKPADNELQRTLRVARGARRDALTIIEDWYPTVLWWAGLPPPDDYTSDGRDFSPQLQVDPPNDVPRPLLFHYPHVWGPRGDGYEPHSALRLGRYKVIYFYQPRRWELYDLEADLSEQNNLAQAEPKRLRELAGRLIGCLDARKARFPWNRDTEAPERPVMPH